MGGPVPSATHLIDVTSHPLATAYLHILEPRKPFPPQTMIFFAAAFDMVEDDVLYIMNVRWMSKF